MSPRIMSLRHREEQLEAAREDAETQLEQRRVELPDTEEIARYVADFRDFLKDGTIPERKALIRNFVEGIEVMGDEATLTYTVPMPSDGAMSESASVLDFVKSSPPKRNRTWAGGPTVLLDNRESRPFRHLPASFVLRNRLAPCPPGPATPYRLDGWSERSRLSPSQGWEVAGSGG